MKLFLVALTAVLSTAAAFAPVNRCSTSSSTVLYGLDGHQIRAARGTFAPGHFETYGAGGDAGRSPVNGEDVREARSSYAKSTNYERVSGEIGFEGPRRQVTPASAYSISSDYVGMFAPSSEAGSGGYSAPAAAASPAAVRSSPPAKAGGYGIGSGSASWDGWWVAG